MIIDTKQLQPIANFVVGMPVAFIWNGVVNYGTFLNEQPTEDDHGREIKGYKVKYTRDGCELTHVFEYGLYKPESIKELQAN